MAIKNYVKDQISLLAEQIKDAEEAIKVLKSLGRPTALEESQVNKAKTTMNNLTKYVESE